MHGRGRLRHPNPNPNLYPNPNPNPTPNPNPNQVVFGTIINATAAEWRFLGKGWPCVMLALDPKDALHFIYTHPPTTYRSLDGGKTRLSCNHSNIFHAGIDQHGTYYTAAMGGAFRSVDRGASWQAFYDVRVARRTNASRVRVPRRVETVVLGGGATQLATLAHPVVASPGSWPADSLTS